MRNCIFCIAALCFLLGPIVLAVEGDVNLTGTWTVDKTGSDSPQQMGRGGARRPGGHPAGTFPNGGVWGGGRRSGGRSGDNGQEFNGDMTFVIQQTADSLTISRKTGAGDGERTVEQHFTLDGKESTNPAPMGRGEVRSTAELKKDKLVIQNTRTLSGRNGEIEVHSKEEFTIADSGQTLIIKTTRSTSRGDQSFKQVFTKQQ